MSNRLCRTFCAVAFAIGGFGVVGVAVDDAVHNRVGPAVTEGLDALVPFLMSACVARLPESEFSIRRSAKAAAPKPNGT